MRKFAKLALHSVAAVAAMSVFICGATQTVAAEEWYVYEASASNMVPTVIANDSSQVILKLLVRDRDWDTNFSDVYSWEKIDKTAPYDMHKGIVRNVSPGQWAQYNITQDNNGNVGNQRLIDVQVTLADGRRLELDNIDILTEDVVLTDEGLLRVKAAKNPSPQPADVTPGSYYFRSHRPQGCKEPDPYKDIPQGYVMVDGELVKWE